MTPGTWPVAWPRTARPFSLRWLTTACAAVVRLAPYSTWPNPSWRSPTPPTSKPSLTTTMHRPLLPQLPVDVLAQALEGVVRLREVHLQRHAPLGVGEARGRCDEARLPSHRLQHGHGLGHAHAPVLLLDVLDQVRPVPGRAAVPRGVVDQLELLVAHVVVDGLGHAGHHQVDPAPLREGGDLGGRVHGVVASDVEEVPDVVGAHHVDDALEVFLLAVGQLVPARADGPRGGRGAEQRQLPRRLLFQVDELLEQHAFDAVPRPEDAADAVGESPAPLDDAGERSVDDGRGPAGLGNQGNALHGPWYTRIGHRCQRSAGWRI